MGVRIILLNGLGSVGKSSLARALQRIARRPMLHVQMDTFLEMLPPNPEGYAVETTATDGKPTTAITLGRDIEKVLRGMRLAVAAMASGGNDMVIDEVTWDQAVLADYRQLLASFDFVAVGLAPIDVIEQRERQRGDRALGIARWHNERVHAGMTYDLLGRPDRHAGRASRPDQADLPTVSLPPSPKPPGNGALMNMIAKRPALRRGPGPTTDLSLSRAPFPVRRRSGTRRIACTTCWTSPKDLVALNRQKAKKLDLLKGRTLVNLFFEASTRTQSSFELAGKRLADVVNMPSPRASSISKGETLIDTAVDAERAMQPDILVVRHGASDAASLLSQKVTCSVINAGDGQHEHPSQALLDALAMRRAFGKIEGLTVAICGDVLHSRVARSNVGMLTALGARCALAGPPTLMPRWASIAGAPKCSTT